MRRRTRRRLLAASLSLLLPSARASEIRFEPPVSADQARRWEAAARTAWADWEARFGARVDRPAVSVGLTDVSALPRDLGRTRASRIELNASLPAAAADATFRHELAHVFLEAACPGVAASSALLSEAFALHASGDAARRYASEPGLPTLTEARAWLAVHAEDAKPGTRETTRPLVRVLARPGAVPRWDPYFHGLLSSCRDVAFSSTRALSDFLEATEGTTDLAAARSDLLAIDGLSGEALAAFGRRSRFPAGSILKPSLVAAVPALLESRPARGDASWRCPRPPRAGEPMRWEDALRKSCNGFFLDAALPEGAFAEWEETLRRLGLSELPRTMEGRIGLLGNVSLSVSEAVRLYAWLDRAAPHVIDALRGTAASGTLAASPEAAWFVARGIALKTGTVRDERSAPEDAWIVAVGPRAAGAPSFVAALHASGRATSSLLPELRRILESVLTGLETPAEVQILGLLPPSAVGLGCPDGVPLAVRDPMGAWRLEPSGTTIPVGTLEGGSLYACPASGIVATFPLAGGRTRARTYAGALRVETAAPAVPESSFPLRERSARARAGSRYVLETSERSYAVASLVAEATGAPAEVLKALALVVRNNRLARRHGDRPPCDTTHCNLFGHDERHPQATGNPRVAVGATAALEIVPPPSRRTWLPFALGGTEAWEAARSAAVVREELGLPTLPLRLFPAGDSGDVDVQVVEAGRALRVSCETLRNQLKLPSCPEEIEPRGDGFVFRGAGDGHGEGLDLTVAIAAAKRGADFRALLESAYPGIEVRPISGGGAASPRPSP